MGDSPYLLENHSNVKSFISSEEEITKKDALLTEKTNCLETKTKNSYKEDKKILFAKNSFDFQKRNAKSIKWQGINSKTFSFNPK